MNASTSASPAHETSRPANPAFEDPARSVDRDRSAVARLASSSVEKLDGLITELKEMREVLRSEGERVQRELGQYAQLAQTAQTAVAATKTITDTVAPGSSLNAGGQVPNSAPRQLSGGREKLKRWPAPAG